MRHLSGLIYDGVDDFVRGPNVTGPTKRNHSSRCECAANPRRRRWIVLSVNFLARFSAKSESALTVDDLCRQRNLANAASTHSSVATAWGGIRPIDGGRVCRSSFATATSHAPPHGIQSLHRGASLPMMRSLQARIFAVRGAIELSQPKSHQNHDVAAAANASRRTLLVSLWNSAPALEKRSA